MKSGDLLYCVYSCWKSLIRPSLCRRLFAIFPSFFAFVALFFLLSDQFWPWMCVCAVCQLVLLLLCFKVLWDLFSSLPVWFLPEPFGSSASLCDNWMSLRTPCSEPGNAGTSSCLWDSGHVFGPTWQGEIENGGGGGGVEGVWMRGLLWHCRERVGILESSRGSANVGGGLSPPKWPPQRRESLWLDADQNWQGQQPRCFAKGPVWVHLASSHMTGDVSDRPCVWCFCVAALKSLVLACLCCDHMGGWGPALPLWSASGSGVVCLPVSIDVAAFQRMSLCFPANLILFSHLSSLQGWLVSVQPLCY